MKVGLSVLPVPKDTGLGMIARAYEGDTGHAQHRWWWDICPTNLFSYLQPNIFLSALIKRNIKILKVLVLTTSYMIITSLFFFLRK
jgi:hypothetical protein